MLNRADVTELITDQLLPLYSKERERLDRLDLWYRWRGEELPVPRGATRELRRLIELARDPWLRLVVSETAQAMYVDGYRSPDQAGTIGWRSWQANDMDNRQVPIHRAALAYGLSFATILPGELNGERRAVIRGVSPRKMVTVYADEVEDDWPMYGLRVEQRRGQPWPLRLYDDEVVYYATTTDSTATKVEFIEARPHEVGVCPIARYANLDLDGRTDGEVEPFISVAARINKTSYDRLLTQHFSSWKVRTVAGMAQPDTQEESNRTKLKLRQDDVLIAEDKDTKFGTLDETPLDGFVRAKESDITHLAATSQTPVTSLTGNVANLSADAIAELRSSHTQKVFEWQKSLGKSHEQTLRLAAHVEGDELAAGDVMAHVTWADMQVRSLSQAVDALGKAAQMLGIPPQALWSRIPGVSKTDVDEWEQMAQSNDAMAQLTQLLEAQITNGNT